MLEGISGVRPPGFDGPKGSGDRGGPGASSKAGKSDQVELSAAGVLLARLQAMPDVRPERVEEIRTQILHGTYVTEDKVNAAVDKLVDEFLQGV